MIIRLIDADAIRVPNDERYKGALKRSIEQQPTAYDVNKVISQIENKIFTAELYGDEWDGQTVDNLLCMGDVYEIVKGGGADE